MMTASRSKVRWLVKLPEYKTQVRFENLKSCQRYCRDLHQKKIKYECKFYYEPERVSKTSFC